MAKRPSDIPVGTQFSPNVVHLPSFLAAIEAHSGDKAALEGAVWTPPVRVAPVANPPTSRRRSLPLEAAVQYGLLNAGDYTATDLARRLRTLTEPDVYDAFARHILVNLGGLRVVEACQQMEMDGLDITGDALAAYLSSQGFNVSVHNTAINSLRMWLALAGIFPTTKRHPWRVDAGRKEALVGMDDALIAGLVGLTENQRAFVLALCRVAPSGRYPAADIRSLAETIAGRALDRANLPKAFLEPLARLGLIQYTTKGTAGGKTSVLETTAPFEKEVLQPFLESAVKHLDAAVTAYYLRPIQSIYPDLVSNDPNVKGEALEAFAIQIMRLLGMRFVAWRKRARDETGRAEVDVVMTGMMGGLFSRWQVQCKNKPSGRVSLEDVAKEVGLVPLTKATHILIIANSQITSHARSFADEVMRSSNLTIFLLDKDDFERLRSNPASLAETLRSQSMNVQRLSRAGISLWQ